jgi:2-polyprenyl-3-methyl-5-hydroxy-6-metoxy-1,4-benzoquinol methylase
MSKILISMKNAIESDKVIFDKYHETHYKELHEWRDYELTSKGFEEWYYNCLPKEKTARILDIGCGDGKFLFYLTKKGYRNIEGLELSAQQANEARKNVNCPIHAVDDTQNFLFKKSNTYQLVTLNDVLEHIPKRKVVKFLQAVHDALKPGGNVIVNVPQASGFTGLFCRYNDFTHETLFTELSLRQVLCSARLSNVKFIQQKLPVKFTFRHLSYRVARQLWFLVLKLIYTIELPGEKHPSSFQGRLVASANRSLQIKNE